ncbi:dihydrofolate reductase family protein [Pseudomonas oryzihabitans]|uniref:dihydrofolate reductase family protein n=1 Tax=Pseudomonas oryzihabitans TaxID=47885 RepID=UPI003EB930FF
MKPYVICHMMSSVDGHALTDGWDRTLKKQADTTYERLAERFDFDAWACGRVTMEEIAHGEGYPKGVAQAPIPRTHHFAKRDASKYAIAIDPQGKVAWKKNEALDSHVVAVLSEAVSDDYLAHLQSIGASYVFGGQQELDLAAVLELLNTELGIERLVVEGGPHVSGSFVAAGLVDEISVLIIPLVDGRGAHPASFEIAEQVWQQPLYLKLDAAEAQDDGSVWLRYRRA